MNEIRYTAYLEGSLKLSKYGEWWHNGVQFQNQRLAELFHRSIVWDEEEQKYFVRIGPQRASFTCEDTAYFVVALDVTKSPWQILLADGSTEVLDPSSLRCGKEDQIYCQVKHTYRARFKRAAYQVLLQHVRDEDTLLIDDKEVRLERES